MNCFCFCAKAVWIAVLVAAFLSCTQAKRRYGASCDSDSACESGLCYHELCTTSCTTGSQCTSGICIEHRCDPRTGTDAHGAADTLGVRPPAVDAQAGDNQGVDAAEAPTGSDGPCAAPLYDPGSGNCAQIKDWAQWPLPPVAPAGNYTVSPSSLSVHDTVTGLVWQRDVAPGELTFSKAKDYCQDLAIEGGGWHLPTRIELASIIDYTQTQPAIDAKAFPATPGSWYWTSTPALWDVPAAFSVSFYNGAISFDPTSELRYARCVRSEPTLP